MPLCRRAVPGDAPALARLAEQTFRATFADANTPENLALHCRKSYGTDLQAAEILDPAMLTVLAEEQGALAGYFQLRWRPPDIALAATRPAEIPRFYLDARWHGSGLAQTLMQEAFRLAREGGADLVWLSVWERNARALAFYRRCGFSQIGTHSFLLGQDPQRDRIPTRILAHTLGA